MDAFARFFAFEMDFAREWARLFGIDERKEDGRVYVVSPHVSYLLAINAYLTLPSTAQFVQRRRALVFDWTLVGMPMFYTETLAAPTIAFGGKAIAKRGEALDPPNRWIHDVLHRHRPEHLPAPRRPPPPPDYRLETRLEIAADMLACKRFWYEPTAAALEETRDACEHILKTRERLRAAAPELAAYALEVVDNCKKAAVELNKAV